MPPQAPKPGEFSYYDSRKKEDGYWLVVINGKLCACHYSVPEKQAPEPFVSCNGKIESVHQSISIPHELP